MSDWWNTPPRILNREEAQEAVEREAAMWAERGHGTPIVVYGHACNEQCVCPIHQTPLLYNRHHNQHACQDPGCEHAHGIKP